MSFNKFRVGVGTEGDSQKSRDVPLRLEAPRRECGGGRGNEIGYHVNHVNRSLERAR